MEATEEQYDFNKQNTFHYARKQSQHYHHIVTDFINAFPGKSSANTVQHATIDDAVFYVISATPSAANGPMNSQSDT
jgi:hypothetical protein